jgi:N-dimethylarginine dimethylaminohydrolase
MTQHVLMCEPLHFRIAYEINPWMRRANQVAGPVALEQWRRLRQTLDALGVRVELIEQDEGVPDMTFTANAGVVAGRRFIPANFRHAERQPEAALFTAWFIEHGYEAAPIHEPHYWEGEGDVLPADGHVFAGYRFRTEFRALDHLDELLETETVRLELVDPRYYHLDTCFCPLGAGRVLYYPPAFSAESRQLIEQRFTDRIVAADADAARFACNALVVDSAVVMNTGCPSTVDALAQRGLRAVETATDEFIKAGGSVKCLVLMLDAFERWATDASES